MTCIAWWADVTDLWMGQSAILALMGTRRSCVVNGNPPVFTTLATTGHGTFSLVRVHHFY